MVPLRATNPFEEMTYVVVTRDVVNDEDELQFRETLVDAKKLASEELENAERDQYDVVVYVMQAVYQGEHREPK